MKLIDRNIAIYIITKKSFACYDKKYIAQKQSLEQSDHLVQLFFDYMLKTTLFEHP